MKQITREFTGNLADDPEVKVVELKSGSEKEIVVFTVAVGTGVDDTVWIDCTSWDDELSKNF